MRDLRVRCGFGLVMTLAVAAGARGQESPSPSSAPVGRQATTQAAEQVQEQAQEPAQDVAAAGTELKVPGSHYDKAMFLKPIPADQMTFLKGFAGANSYDLFRDKQFRKLMKSFVPNCEFHYGRDMALDDALDRVFENSRVPVQIRDGRYVMISGLKGPYLGGRAMLWVDLQDGIGLGAFWFHPTNGEPTPALNVFSRQVKQEYLAMSDLPPAFARDLSEWTMQASIGPVETRYFLTGSNKKELLEHDEDFCRYMDGTPAPAGSGCEQMNADAADLDVTAAEYVGATHHATNATAWMLNDPTQIAWIQVRDRTCVGPGALGCRIRMGHQRVRVIIKR